jgi:arylformamidase
MPRRWFDISPVISPRNALFPGEAPFRREVSLDFKSGHNLLLSSIQTTVHVGAHTDAPNHYSPEGASIDVRPLDLYFGACEVRTVSLKPRERIGAEHGKSVRAPRVLFRTGSFPNPEQWRDDFNALSPELVDALADQGVVLIGIDTPSVDIADDAQLLSHNAIFRRDLAILEGVVLAKVPDGLYTLMALPLRLEGADASPVRAVLLDDGGRAGGAEGSFRPETP